MENATVERTLFCDEIPNVTINASNGAIVKVVFNTVNPAGKKTTVIMGREHEMAGMTVAPDATGFAVAGKESDYMLSPAVDEDEFSALLCWINKYPTMAAIFREKAEVLGGKYDAIIEGSCPKAPSDAVQGAVEPEAVAEN